MTENPQTCIPLLQAMEEAFGDIAVDVIHGSIHHTRQFLQNQYNFGWDVRFIVFV